ncbi:RraA family protein [Streptomyces pilosus]|uniref:Putative 4-hydroxy-4-methyl-2-oxoglutarate aldolase n=1 Tax=Streptomyces pilosus TaxID=28893 RepID=A0A918BSE2_9ACTN|nr:RraA family protein [Streptomyces pilosus]GGQ85000.1 dimethylmenaquinone methyltransferase [Streptomyces pilosus]
MEDERTIPADQGGVLAALGCATLVDAMGRVHGHRAHILPMASPDPGRPLFGLAATIAYMPWRDNLEQSSRTFADFYYSALGSTPSGKVLVLSSGGFPEASHGGGTKLSRAAHHGLAGVLADGRLRDFGQLRAYPFPTWCRGEATRWGGDTVMPFMADVAVEFGGVCVTPGDYAFADASGAVIIPARSLERVLDAARRIEAEEDRAARDIRREEYPGA